MADHPRNTTTAGAEPEFGPIAFPITITVTVAVVDSKSFAAALRLAIGQSITEPIARRLPGR